MFTLQVVTLEYESGATAVLNMVATSELICRRQTKVYGSKGEITCTDEGGVTFR